MLGGPREDFVRFSHVISILTPAVSAGRPIRRPSLLSPEKNTHVSFPKSTEIHPINTPGVLWEVSHVELVILQSDGIASRNRTHCASPTVSLETLRTSTTRAWSASQSSIQGYSSRSLDGSGPSMAVEIEQGELVSTRC